MEKRIAKVSGSLLKREPNEQFDGEITFEARPDCIYYQWRIKTKVDKWFKAKPVSFRIIPKDINPFDFALEYALEDLRRYRLNRQRLFDVNQWIWVDDSK